MEDVQLESLLIQNKKAYENIDDSLDIIIQQSKNNNVQTDIEAVIVSNSKTKKEIAKGNKKIVEAIDSLNKSIKDIKYPDFPEFPEQKEEFVIKNIKEIVDKLEEVKNELNKEQEINITLDLI